MRRSLHRLDFVGALVCAPLVLPACASETPPERPSAIAIASADGAPWAAVRAQPLDGRGLMAQFGCGACHVGVPAPASPAKPLRAGGGPRDPAALFAYLSDSLPAAAGGARMPDFHLEEREALALALYLGAGRPGGDARRSFQAAVDEHDDIDAADGERLYAAFGCGACHGGLTTPPDAPTLATEGSRVRAEWLEAFLRAPHAIRPFGVTPGSGARMPNFGLTADEAAAIAQSLLENAGPLPAYTAEPITPFGVAKWESLLEHRLDCLGCHALDGHGGRIAPDLALSAARLQPAYIRAMLDDPARHAPGTIMPRPRMPASQRDALAAFLTQRGSQAIRPSYLSPLEHPLLEASSAVESGGTYRRLCAACHGEAGAGDGFNARYLDAPPARHADSAAMARRPDDTLFDGIAAGGRILGGSTRMPAFGGSLDADQIRALVTHIRTLCRCAPPAWSTDGQR